MPESYNNPEGLRPKRDCIPVRDNAALE